MINEELLKNGYLSFNLKDYNVNYYNQLRELIPYKNVNVLEPMMNSFLFCAELKMTIPAFYAKFEELAKDSGFIFGPVYEKHKKVAIDKSHDGDNYLSTWFHMQDMNVLRKIKKIIFDNFEFEQNQSWYDGSLGLENKKYHPIVSNIIKEIVTELYDRNVDDYFTSSALRLNISSFPEGSLITDHQDGYNPNRLAAVLIYLNDEWDSKNGGQLLLDKKAKIEPEFGNVVIFEFTENNIHHEVLKVANDVERWAFITFLETR